MPWDREGQTGGVGGTMHITFTNATMEISQRKECVSRLHHHDGTTLEWPSRMNRRETVPTGERIGGRTLERTTYNLHRYLESCMVWSRTTDLLPSTAVDGHTEAIRTTHRSKS